MKRLILVTALGGCIAPETIDTGPEVHVRLTSPLGASITDKSTNLSIGVDTTSGMYKVTMTIETTQGERTRDSNFDRFEVTSVEGALAVPNVTLPALTFEPEGIGDKDFNSKEMIVIPASAKNQMMTVTAQGFDERGLSSNLLTFAVLLR